MAAENKTKATAVSVDAFLAAVPDEGRRADAHALRAMMERLTGAPAVMWGPSIIGFGSYHYKYESGREGDSCRIGFSPRAKELVLYGTGAARRPDAAARLGKHRLGKGCLYIKRLGDVDAELLETLMREELAEMRLRYPE